MKLKAVMITIVLCMVFAGCSTEGQKEQPEDLIQITDCAGNSVAVSRNPQRVVALSSSFADIWLLAGGELAGATSDAVNERDLGLGNDVQIVGTVMDPGLETILALQPDLVILSQDIDSHQKATETFAQTGVPFYTAKVETLDDYLKVLRDFTELTGRDDCYEQNGTAVHEEVQAVLKRVPQDTPQSSALFLRAYSTGVRAKADEHIVCDILTDFGVENIAYREQSLLDDLSFEVIIQEDPDYILIVTMGSSSEDAIATLDSSLRSHPAWENLTAVQNDRVHILPKELFHYKPNSRWGEAYEYLYEIIFSADPA